MYVSTIIMYNDALARVAILALSHENQIYANLHTMVIRICNLCLVCVWLEWFEAAFAIGL